MQQNDLIWRHRFAGTMLTEARDDSIVITSDAALLFLISYSYWSTNSMELSTVIIREIQAIPANILQKYVDNLIIRLEECRDKNGPYLEDVIFCT